MPFHRKWLATSLESSWTTRRLVGRIDRHIQIKVSRSQGYRVMQSFVVVQRRSFILLSVSCALLVSCPCLLAVSPIGIV
jgi:hypothetical protein